MTIARRSLLAALSAAPLLLSGCAATGNGTPPFESNASFRLMLYG